MKGVEDKTGQHFSPLLGAQALIPTISSYRFSPGFQWLTYGRRLSVTTFLWYAALAAAQDFYVVISVCLFHFFPLYFCISLSVHLRFYCPWLPGWFKVVTGGIVLGLQPYSSYLPQMCSNLRQHRPMDFSYCMIGLKCQHWHEIVLTTVHLSVSPFSSSLYFSRALLVYCIIYHKVPILLTYVYIRVVVLSCVYAQMHLSMSMCRRSCLQVLYEFHLSAAWGTMWRISPNGLVCNCSVNTRLSRLGECGEKKAPHSNALKPLIEQPIAIYLLTVAGGEGAQPGNRDCVAHSLLPGLHCY